MQPKLLDVLFDMKPTKEQKKQKKQQKNQDSQGDGSHN
jgi:hypothetical protein